MKADWDFTPPDLVPIKSPIAPPGYQLLVGTEYLDGDDNMVYYFRDVVGNLHGPYADRFTAKQLSDVHSDMFTSEVGDV